MNRFTFFLEMSQGQSRREVGADEWAEKDGWLVFYRTPPTGGKLEYWRVRTEYIISMETRLT